MAENHQSARLAPVRYTVRFPQPSTHYAEVEVEIPTDGQEFVEVFMPVWTPGSYLIREYARHVEISLEKTRKNRWRVPADGAEVVRFSYRVYCREMTVRTNWVDDSFALLNGAPTFITAVGGTARPHEVRIELPEGWSASISGLEKTKPNHFVAPDYDTLADSPIFAGNPSIHEFTVDGIPHFLVNEGEAGVWDGARSAADVRTIVEQHRAMWGALPYRKFVILNLLAEGTGGLEHRNSFTILASRRATGDRRAYAAWLELVAHEFFHTWNVKRLRPVELGPFDYEAENYTEALWVVEGLTSYYAPLIVRRAGLSTDSEFLGTGGDQTRSLSSLINTVENTPGRLAQSLEQASFDAWTKFYRPDENTNNTTVSYYTKGAVVGWLLDARIRRATAGIKSLDDLMRLAFARYSGERGYTTGQFKALASEVAGENLDGFFAQTVESALDLDYQEALDWFGLQFREPNTSTKAYSGIETKVDSGRLVITRVIRESPAYQAGLNVEDEILAIDGYRVRADPVEHFKAGQQVRIVVARRDKLTTLDLTFGTEPRKWQLEIRPDASPEQRIHLDLWLSGSPCYVA